MRRLGSTCLNLWIVFVVPSLIVWGLMLRWSTAGADRFESAWRWTADWLTFPLLFSALTDWSWHTLATGSPLTALAGFGVLVAVWALMFALPLVLIGYWWVWIAARLGGGTSGSSSGGYDGGSRALGATTGQSPMGALYLITVPIALLYHATRIALSILRPAALTFIACWGLALVVIALYFSQVDPWRWGNAFEAIRHDGWEGYLDSLRIPRLFNEQWYERWNAMWARQMSPNLDDRLGDPGDWRRYSDLWYLMGFHAARHALAPALVVAAWSMVAALFTRRRSTA